MTKQINIPTHHNDLQLPISTDESVIFVGPNGGGKTRLAVYLEKTLGEDAHRISAHRALALNPKVQKVDEKSAIDGLRYGRNDNNANLSFREHSRWRRNPATSMLNDFDFLLQALFAEYTNVAVEMYETESTERKPTKLGELKKLWEELLPTRKLETSSDDILVKPADMPAYSASEMSDGERSIFYLIGQVLVAPSNTTIIVDEPELHIHRSLMGALWDKLESTRSDCCFIYITHDLEFASQRVARKFIISEYSVGPKWTIEEVPGDSGFSEEITTLILGSRKPILFVEGAASSWDVAIYRACYPDYTVIPKGSCSEVVHSVATLRNNPSLTRITCAGVVDLDGQSEVDVENLKSVGVQVLPTSEIENLFLLPEITCEIGKNENFSDSEISQKQAEICKEICSIASSEDKLDATVVRHTKRQLDAQLKKIDFGQVNDEHGLESEYKDKVGELDVVAIASTFRAKLVEALEKKDVEAIAKYYDDKGFITVVAKQLRSTGKQQFKSWVLRVISKGADSSFIKTLKELLPEIEVA